MLYKNYISIITHNNLSQSSAAPTGYRVVEPGVLLCSIHPGNLSSSDHSSPLTLPAPNRIQ